MCQQHRDLCDVSAISCVTLSVDLGLPLCMERSCAYPPPSECLKVWGEPVMRGGRVHSDTKIKTNFQGISLFIDRGTITTPPGNLLPNNLSRTGPLTTSGVTVVGQDPLTASPAPPPRQLPGGENFRGTGESLGKTIRTFTFIRRHTSPCVPFVEDLLRGVHPVPGGRVPRRRSGRLDLLAEKVPLKRKSCRKKAVVCMSAKKNSVWYIFAP